MDKKYDVITIGSIPLLYSDIIPKQIPKALHLYTLSESIYGYRVMPPYLKNCIISKLHLPLNEILKKKYVKQTDRYMTIKEYDVFWKESSRISGIFEQEDAIDAIDHAIDMWQWLALHPEYEKESYFILVLDQEPVPMKYCYLCEMVYKNIPIQSWKNYSVCRYLCPVRWTSGADCFAGCEGENSPYEKWSQTLNKNLRTIYAQQVVRRLQEAKREIKATKNTL